MGYNARLMTSPYDLHSHSWISDGTLGPSELVQRAHTAGVKTLALTDHDDTSGCGEAIQAASDRGMRLIPGVEVSVTWQRMTIHIVGLNVDPNHAGLVEGLAGLREYRDQRAIEIGRRLEKHRIFGAYEGAQALAQGRIISRTHFAHYLVSQGCGKTVRDVFKHYLVKNKPGHVGGQWASLEEAVGWIRAAGGQAVIAHPARYKLTATKRRRLAGEFMECGGEGIEVVSGSHSRDECQTMAKLANDLELYASTGSDYHGPENPWVDLGRLPDLPETCRPIWESPNWLARQSEQAA